MLEHDFALRRGRRILVSVVIVDQATADQIPIKKKNEKSQMRTNELHTIIYNDVA